MTSKNKKSEGKVLLVAQEIKLARRLAENDKISRDKALKSLKKWLQNRYNLLPFSDDDFLRIWKGLYFSMWMSDKLLVQEECAENIANLIHFPTAKVSLQFFENGLNIIGQQWFGIDQLRLNKFLMLVRRLLRQALFVLKNNKWKLGVIEIFNNAITKTILGANVNIPYGLWMHFVEIFLEEVSKVSEGKIKQEALILLLKPFILALAKSDDDRRLKHLCKFIFIYLIRQSELGLEYQEKYDAWKQQGFPGNINSMKKIELSDEENISDSEEEVSDVVSAPLDPRAGHVNVDLPQLKVSPKLISNSLLEVKYIEGSGTKSRKMLMYLTELFKKMAFGIYPLGVQKIKVEKSDADMNVRKAVNRLLKFEKKVNTRKEKTRKRKASECSGEILSKKQRSNYQTIKENGNCNNTDNSFETSKIKKKTDKFNNDKLKIPFKKKEKTTQVIDTPSMKSLNKIDKDKIEYMFERNSGTWYVYDTAQSSINEKLDQSNPSLGLFISQNLEEISYDQVNMFISNVSPKHKSLHIKSLNREKISLKNKKDSTFKTNKTLNLDQQKEPQNKRSPKEQHFLKIEQTPPKSDQNDNNSSVKLSPIELFPKNKRDEPLQDNEYEICIPSKKHVKKLKKLGKQTNTDGNILINTSISGLRGKNRLSLDSKLVINPFYSTQSSIKKVKINTKLNKSQDVEEHHAQLLSSPGIPYDADRKPSKPLLKRTSSVGIINPFYNKQLQI